MKKTIAVSVLLFSVLFLGACKKQNHKDVVEGYKPIYATEAELENVEIRTDEQLEHPGRIYVYENLLLVNDKAKGIHIYDNSNPSSPIHQSFMAIPGNMDFSVKQGLLYADNITDMVIIDISNPNTPEYANRIRNVFPVQVFPDEFGAFECVDPEKGVVVGWQKTTLTDPKCYK